MKTRPRNILAIILIALLCVFLSPKESNAMDTDHGTQNMSAESKGMGPANKILVAYFSRADENYNVGYIEKGNTEIIAEMIAKQVNGTLFHIKTVMPYPTGYKECTEVAKKEKADGARPKIVGKVEDFADYNIVFLGYPNWWSDMPMAVYTFLESYDFSGKTIIPFITHEGSGLSNTVKSIAEYCPNAKVLDGLAIKGSIAQKLRDEAQKTVTNWLSKIPVLH